MDVSVQFQAFVNLHAEKNACTHWIEVCVCPTYDLDVFEKRKYFICQDSNSASSDLYPSHYTNWDIPTHPKERTEIKTF